MDGAHEQMKVRRSTALILVLLLTAALAPHLPAWDASFTYDDRSFVEQNTAIRTMGGALGAFLSPFPPNERERGLYRPLTALSYALDHTLWGDEPSGFHRVNLLYYALTVLLLFALLRRWIPGHGQGPLWGAAVGALLFAVHPVHCEAVDSISGRSELLALLFALGALLLFEWFLREQQGVWRWLWLGSSAFCVLLAALSKETGAVTPGLMAVRLLLGGGGHRRWAALLPAAAVLTLYMALRLDSLEGALGPSQVVMGDRGLSVRLHTVGAVLFEYARLLIAPTTLQVDAYYERVVGVQEAASLRSVAGLALLLLLVLLWLVLLRRAVKAPAGTISADGAAALGLSALLIYLLPVSHLIPFGALMAERLLYAPSVGLCVLVAALSSAALDRPGRRRPLLAALGCALLLLLATRSHLRAEQWRDPVTLWTPVVAELDDDYRAYNNLATGYIQRGELQRATQALRRSLSLRPDHPRALSNLGFVYMQTGRLVEARRVLEALVAAQPRHFLALNNLGVIATRRGDNARARRRYLQALKVNPNYLAARRNLAAVDVVQARARSYLDTHRSRIHDTSAPEALLRYASACFAVGDYACAKKYRALAQDRRAKPRAPAQR